MVMSDEAVTLNFTSWNRIAVLLRQLDSLRVAT
jgi:hypothetical protein